MNFKKTEQLKEEFKKLLDDFKIKNEVTQSGYGFDEIKIIISDNEHNFVYRRHEAARLIFQKIEGLFNYKVFYYKYEVVIRVKTNTYVNTRL